MYAFCLGNINQHQSERKKNWFKSDLQERPVPTSSYSATLKSLTFALIAILYIPAKPSPANSNNRRLQKNKALSKIVFEPTKNIAFLFKE